MTSKGLRHIQMRENSTREQQLLGFCTVIHLPGENNLSDMFIKEDKNIAHFIGIRDAIVKSSASAYRIKIHDVPPIIYALPGFILYIRSIICCLLSCHTHVGGIAKAVCM